MTVVRNGAEYVAIETDESGRVLVEVRELTAEAARLLLAVARFTLAVWELRAVDLSPAERLELLRRLKLDGRAKVSLCGECDHGEVWCSTCRVTGTLLTGPDDWQLGGVLCPSCEDGWTVCSECESIRRKES